jgi:hypothetical protein
MRNDSVQLGQWTPPGGGAVEVETTSRWGRRHCLPKQQAASLYACRFFVKLVSADFFVIGIFVFKIQKVTFFVYVYCESVCLFAK